MDADAQAIATRAAQLMWAADQASNWLGLKMVSVGPGQAIVKLDLKDHHLNGHGICHGGIIFMLADSAFALACNSYNQIAVAQHNSITYLAPGQPGSTLTAQASQVSLTGRSGLYDVVVRDETGTVIAQFRGHSRVIRGQHFNEDQS